MRPEFTFDVVIAGGAVMGSSVAYHLLAGAQAPVRVLVVEPDSTYQRSASALSAGSIRQQFSAPVNIAISLHGIAFLRALPEHLSVEGSTPEVGLVERGYLYLADEDGKLVLTVNNRVQREMGADIVLLDRPALGERFPFLTTADLACGSHGQSGEGWFDGYGLCQAFRAKARALGAEYRQGSVVDVERSGGKITAAVLADGTRIACGAFVNCAGASGARALCERLGFPVPVRAKKRCVFNFTCREPLERFPLIIDTTGVWVRPEGQGYITGFSPDDLDDSDNAEDYTVDWSIWDQTIWPALAARIPAFEAVKPGRAWAGHYDMNLLDHNALVGRLPGTDNAYMAAGFSGHGLQQSPAVGRGLAELIHHGRYTTLDLSDLGCERVAENRPLLERNVI
jgi:glycine/D-amino acid oxidase-like deaminating enzyme